MKRRILGGTGISVSEYALGTMMFGAMGNTDHDESVRIIHAAIDAGINFIDTADVYSTGRVGGDRRQGARRAGATTSCWRPSSAARWARTRTSAATHRAGSCASVENSLRRLGTDYIDLYQMHRPDPDTDIDETLGALSDLVREGKVRAIGSSTFPPERSSKRSGRPSAVATSASVRAAAVLDPRARHRAAVLPTAQRYGMGVHPLGPLNGGWLSGQCRRDGRAPQAPAARAQHVRPLAAGRPAKFDAVEELTKLAADTGIS